MAFGMPRFGGGMRFGMPRLGMGRPRMDADRMRGMGMARMGGLRSMMPRLGGRRFRKGGSAR